MKKSLWLMGAGAILLVFLVSAVLAFGKMAQKPAPVVKSPAPDFSLTGINGENISLKTVIKRNKITILNFWATWCPPCRAEIPEFVEFAAKNKGKKIEILAVNVQEDRDTIKAFAKSAGMNFPVLMDPSGKVAQIYQIYAIPTTFFIDNSGIIREKVEGSLSLSQVESICQKIVKGK